MTNTSPAAGRLPVARSRERARTSSKIVWNAPACDGPSRWPRPSFNSAPSISQETSMPTGNSTSNRTSAASTPPGSSFQSSHTQLISTAIHDTEASGDEVGLVRALSLLARGLAELGRNQEAIAYADQALSRVASATDLPYPATAYTAKIQGLIGLKRLVEARGLMNSSMEQVSDRLYFYPELAVCAGMLAEAEGKVSEAVKLYNTAADLCKRYGVTGRDPLPVRVRLFPDYFL